MAPKNKKLEFYEGTDGSVNDTGYSTEELAFPNITYAAGTKKLPTNSARTEDGDLSSGTGN